MNTMCLVSRSRWWIIFIYSVGFIRHCFILVDIIGKYYSVQEVQCVTGMQVICRVDFVKLQPMAVQPFIPTGVKDVIFIAQLKNDVS